MSVGNCGRFGAPLCDGRCGHTYDGSPKCLREIPGGWSKCPGLGHPRVTVTDLSRAAAECLDSAQGEKP